MFKMLKKGGGLLFLILINCNLYAQLSVTGTVEATSFSGTLGTSALNSITSIGQLSNLSVTGTIQGGTFSGSLSSGSTNSITSLGTLSTLTVSGLINAGTVSGTLTTVLQPNITAVGTLSSLTVSGLLAAGSISTTSGGITTSTISGSTLTITGNITAGALSLTSGGISASTLTVTGNITAGTLSLTSGGINASALTATGNITAGTISTTGGGITTSALTVTGNITAGSLSLTSGGINTSSLTATGMVSAGSISASNVNGFRTQATAASTLTLVESSAYAQQFTGSTAGQVVSLPTTSVAAGESFLIMNNSTVPITVQSSGANTIRILGPNSEGKFTALVATPTTAANWNVVTTSYSFQNGFRTQATSASTLTLVTGDAYVQEFTGSTANQIVQLPTTNVGAGQTYLILNNSTVSITVNSSGGNLVQTVLAGTQLKVMALIATPTTAANWDNVSQLNKAPMSAHLASPVATSGTGETLLHRMLIPANQVTNIGSTFRIRLFGISSSTGTLIFRVRVGANGTTADNQAWQSTTSAAQAANTWGGMDVYLTLRSATTLQASGFALATAVVLRQLVGAAATATIAPTANWFIDLDVTCSVGTFTAHNATIELIKP